MTEQERAHVLDEVSRLGRLEKTVNDLLPAFLAINNNVIATSKLKSLLLILRDQMDMLPSRRCILRPSDLEKMKMQMTRCVFFVKNTNPNLAKKIIEENRTFEQPINSMQDTTQWAQSQQQLQQQQLQQQQQQQQQQQFQLQQQQAAAAAQQAAAQQPPPNVRAPSRGASVSDSPNLQNAEAAGQASNKRNSRLDDLKQQQPTKRGKMGKTGSSQSLAVSEASPMPMSIDTPQVVNSPPEDVSSPKTGSARKPKATAAKGKAQAGAAQPRKGKAGSAMSPAAPKEPELAKKPTAAKVESASGKSPAALTVQEYQSLAFADARRKRDMEQEMSEKDPAAFVEHAFNDMLESHTNGTSRFGGGLGSSVNLGSMALQGQGSQSFNSLLSMIGQDAPPSSGMSGAGFNNGFDLGDPSRAEQEAQTAADIDLFDFIDMDAIDGDPFAESSTRSSTMNGSALFDNGPGDTPGQSGSSRITSSSAAPTPALSNSALSKSKGAAELTAAGFELDGGSSLNGPAAPESSDEGEPSPAEGGALAGAPEDALKNKKAGTGAATSGRRTTSKATKHHGRCSHRADRSPCQRHLASTTTTFRLGFQPLFSRQYPQEHCIPILLHQLFSLSPPLQPPSADLIHSQPPPSIYLKNRSGPHPFIIDLCRSLFPSFFSSVCLIICRISPRTGPKTCIVRNHPQQRETVSHESAGA